MAIVSASMLLATQISFYGFERSFTK